MLLFSKIYQQKLFCNRKLFIKKKKTSRDQEKKRWKCFKSFISLGLHVFIYYSKWEFVKKKGKSNSYNNTELSFQLIGEIF